MVSWELMPSWEQDAVKALYQHVREVLLRGLKDNIRIPPEHGGYLVCSLWNVLLFQVLRTPKPSYVRHFHELDEWQQKTDIKMFEAIESSVLQELASNR